MARQVRLVRLADCRHPRRKQEPIRSYGGKIIARRCSLCHRIVQIRKCAGCTEDFALAEASARRGKIYHSEECRRRAYRRRRRERELGGQLDPRDT